MRSFAALAVVIGLSLAASGCDKQSGGAAQGAGNAGATANAAAPDEATADEVASDEVPSSGASAAGETFKHVVDRSHKGEAMPDKPFKTLDGKPASLKQIAGGKPMLVNLWATWCAPCLKEMPALDTLEKEMGGADFAVVAINIDTRNLDKPKAWLAENKVTALPFYGDPQAATFQALRKAHKVEGMPVSIIVDKTGCELGIIQGPADWASADSKALMKAAIGR